MVQVLSPRALQPHGATRYAPGTDVEAYRAGRCASAATSYSYSAPMHTPGSSTPPAGAGGSLSSRNTSSLSAFSSPRQQFLSSLARQPANNSPVKVNGSAPGSAPVYIDPPAVMTGNGVGGTPSLAYTPPVPGPGLGQKSVFNQVVYTSPRSRSPSPPLSPGMRVADAHSVLQSGTPSAPRQGALTPSYPSSPQLSFGPTLGVVRSMSAGSPAGISMAATMPPLYGSHRDQSMAALATPSFSTHMSNGEQPMAATMGPLMGSHSEQQERPWNPAPGAHYDGTRTEQWSAPPTEQRDHWSASMPSTHPEQLEQQWSAPVQANHIEKLEQWSAPVSNSLSEQLERPWAGSNGVHCGQLEQQRAGGYGHSEGSLMAAGNGTQSGALDQTWPLDQQQSLEQQPLSHGVQIQQLEQQLYDFRGLLKQTQDRAAALVNERDHRINMLDRLVEDQRHALDAQRRDAEELRRHQQELLMANREQAQRLSDLETMLNSRDSSRTIQARDVRNIADQKIIDVDRPMSPNLLGHDRIDQTIQEYLDSFPDFYFYVEKVKQGWYKFGKPISKKVYMKVVGNDIVVRVGGGYKELQKFLDEYRLEWLEGRAMLESMEDMNQRQMMRRAMQQNSRKLL